MDTGNKIVIICDGESDKLFPFDQTPPSVLPVANQTCLQILLDTLCPEYQTHVILIAPENADIAKLAMKYQVKSHKREQNIVAQLYTLSHSLQSMLVIKAETLLHVQDIKRLVMAMEEGKNYLLVKELKQDMRSIDIFGCWVDVQIQAIYGHARAHYINTALAGACILQQECFSFLQHVSPGFHQINCGQMCDTQYYMEEALQLSIEAGKRWFPYYPIEDCVSIQFPWDLAKANELAAIWLTTFASLPMTKFTDQSCMAKGVVQHGDDVVIARHVLFEGNCLIGNHVRIEEGVIVGKHCVIGDHSIVRYGSKLSDYTVIGSHNKIGYHAEISGVTFTGVCAVHACEIFGIIGKNVDIAAGVRMAILRFDDSDPTQRVSGKAYHNAYTNRICIGEGSRTGVNSVFLPGVKVGRHCAIGPGVIVEHDIEANTLLLLKQETVSKPWGSQRYGW